MDSVHAPVARGMCGQCHEPPGSPAGFKPKKTGTALCAGCHAPAVTAMLDKSRVHQPVLGGDACLTCHSPHASRKGKLLAGDLATVCGGCHADTLARQARAPTKHQPVADGECTACHDPHGSDSRLFLAKPEVNDVCATCHDWQKHSSHPIGAKAVDPRNRNLSVGCLSCHRAHGTEYKKMLPTPKVTDLCTKCHEGMKR
jgi:predicted CXXCH cytochrome family protein